MLLRTHPLVRVWPPSSLTAGAWAVEHLAHRRRFRTGVAVAAVSLYACEPAPPADLAAFLGTRFDQADAEDVIEGLCRREILVDPDELPGTWAYDLAARWGERGWQAAADYHLWTFDYPCVDYGEDGWTKDRERMREYYARFPEPAPVKAPREGADLLPLPAPQDVERLPSVRALWDEPPESVDWGLAELSTLLSLALGPVGFVQPRLGQQTLIRRTSPSGGSRHPVEGYVLALGVRDLPAACYRVNASPLGLERWRDDLPDAEQLARMIPNSLRQAPVAPRAVLLLTSVFERNMYRYREPRTFRTVHMDAGHVARTASLLATSLGLRQGVVHSDNASAVEDYLQVDPLDEGYMATVVLS